MEVSRQGQLRAVAARCELAIAAFPGPRASNGTADRATGEAEQGHWNHAQGGDPRSVAQEVATVEAHRMHRSSPRISLARATALNRRRPSIEDPRTRAPPQSTCTKAPVSTRSPTSSCSWIGVQHRAHRCPVRSQVSRHSSQIASCGRTGERSARFRLRATLAAPAAAEHGQPLPHRGGPPLRAARPHRPTAPLPVSTSTKPAKLTGQRDPPVRPGQRDDVERLRPPGDVDHGQHHGGRAQGGQPEPAVAEQAELAAP